MTPPTSEAECAWTLRNAWSRHREIALTLTDRCLVHRIVGYIGHVNVTGTACTVDGWTVPLADITDLAAASNATRTEYAQTVRRMRHEQSLHIEGEAR